MTDTTTHLWQGLELRRLGYGMSRAAPATSRIAALTGNATERPTLLVRQAMEFVRAAGEHGATLDEWLAAAHLPQSHSGRFTSLKHAGAIVDSGRRRPTRAGRMATVYVVATHEGREP
jgi:hypothetical protein